MKIVERRRIYSSVMQAFWEGRLRHGSTGEIVTDPKVAQAIAWRKTYATPDEEEEGPTEDPDRQPSQGEEDPQTRFGPW